MVLVRKNKDNTVEILYDVEEQDFPIYENNPNYFFIKETSIPYSIYNFYKLDTNNNIIADEDKNLEKAKSIRKNIIETKYQTALNSGYVCEVNSIKIDCDFVDILKFKAGVELMLSLGQDTMDITDYNGLNHVVKIAEAQQMLKEVGIYFATIRSKRATLQEQIEASATIEDAFNINW